MLKNPPRSFDHFLTRICTVIKTKDAHIYVRGKGPVSIKNSQLTLDKIVKKKIKTKGHIFIGKDCFIQNGTCLENCCIGDISRVGKNVTIINNNLLDVWEVGDNVQISNSFGGRGCVIGDNTIIKNSFIGDGSSINEKCRLTNVLTKIASQIPPNQKLKDIKGELTL